MGNHYNIKAGADPVNEKIRWARLVKNIPQIKKYKTILNIGARKSRFQFENQLKALGYKITVLEIFKPNVDFLQKRKYDVIQGDIRTFVTDKTWDVVLWHHGPEHVTKEEFYKVLPKLEAMATHLIIFGCPWGKNIQTEKSGNKYELHVSAYDTIDFEKVGYKTETTGTKNARSNILSWKYKVDLKC